MAEPTDAQQAGGLRIELPVGRRYAAVAGIPILGLALWLFIGMRSVKIALSGDLGPVWRGFSVVFVAIGAIVLLRMAMESLWYAFGREVLLFDDTSFRIVHKAPLISHAKRLELARIRNLRVSSERVGQFEPIVFDYGEETYRFGAGVDEAEAKQIVTLILERYPALGQSGPT